MKKKVIKPKKIKKSLKTAVLPATLEPDTFDFGGLPKIDLKKNLGCGS